MEQAKTRISEREAGYLELPGAVKDGDCNVVMVEGGISKDRGCCNSFGWSSPDVEYFKCGECKYLSDGDGGEQQDKEKPLTQRNSKGLSFLEILDSQRPVLEGKEGVVE